MSFSWKKRDFPQVLFNFFFKGMTGMKKLATLLLAAGMVVAASAPASAVDVKMDGEYVFTFMSGEYFGSGDNFDRAGQRLRLGMTFTASENLSGYMQMQAGISPTDTGVYDWGTSNNADTKIGLRQAYIDWMIPNTTVRVRMGKMVGVAGLAFDAMGKCVIMGPGLVRDGVVLTTPVTDWLDLTAFWARGGYLSDGTNDTSKSEKSDHFATVARMKFDGFTLDSYLMYAALDRGIALPGSTDGSHLASGNGYWAGASAAFTYFDPFVFKISGAYGAFNYTGLGVDEADNEVNYNDRAGWYVQTKASYATSFGTPILAAWYATGDDADAQYERQNWIPTAGGRFHPTIGFCGGYAGLWGNTVRHNIAGSWGLQTGIENVSFLENLTHTFTVTLLKGTNNSEMTKKSDLNPSQYMSYSDSVVEFDLDNIYNIYKNLSARLQLAYIINDFDESDHAAYTKTMDKNGWTTSLTFTYAF